MNAAVPVNERTQRIGHQHLLFDPALWPDVSADQLTVEHWRAQGAHAAAAGRGNAWFLARPDGEHWVLRHYQRGGLIRKLSPDRYIWLGAARSRAWREFRLLQALTSAGLPVPRPVAACLNRHGLTDTGALITSRIPDAHSLGEHMQSGNLVPDDWQAVGRTIAHMHREQVWHADLNIANLLRDPSGQWTIIDLDRARLREGQAWKAGNLGRLRRSVDKLLNQQPDIAFGENNWNALLVAYQNA